MSISPVDAVGPASSQIKNANNIKRAEALSNDKLPPPSPKRFIIR